MIDFFNRLDKYMKHKGLNDNKITVKAGVSNGLIGKARKKGGGLSIDNISKILYTYSDLSADWLLTGRGTMLNTQSSEQPMGAEIIYNSDPRDAELIASNREIIDTQRKLIASLESRIAEMEKAPHPVRTVKNVPGLHSVPAVDSSYTNQGGAKPK